MKKIELKFNVPKDKEDERRLLIDLEDQVGVIIKKENNKFIVRPYNKLIGRKLASQKPI